jgi:hypothetical protein
MVEFRLVRISVMLIANLYYRLFIII